MNEAILNTFSGGMDLDTSKNKRQPDTYYNAENLRILTNKGTKNGALSSTTGNSFKFNIGVDRNIVGNCSLGEGIVIFAIGINSDLGYSYIYYFEDDGTTASQTLISLSPPDPSDKFRLIYTDETSSAKLNFSNNLEAVGSIESDTIHKVYWVDGANETRFLNILHDEDLNDLTEDLAFNGLGLILDNFNIDITFNKYTSGNLESGRVTYIAQIYEVNGKTSVWSDVSELIPISSNVYGAAYSVLGDQNTIRTSLGIELTLTPTILKPSNIRIAALHYTESETTPNVRIFSEVTASPGDTITVIDSGNTIDVISFEEVRITSPYKLIASSIASKDNILFQANIKEEYFDVDFDARCVRFLYNSSNSYPCDIASTPTVITSSNWDTIDEEADCINPYNDLDNDGDVSKEYCYLENSTTLGLEGENVLVTFTNSPSYTIEEASDLTIESVNTLGSIQIDNDDKYYTGQYRSLQHDEIYRVGIVFEDSLGRSSNVKWVGDIRTPNTSSVGVPVESVTVNANTENVNARHLYLNVSIKSLGSDYANISGLKYKVVAVKRTSADKTVLTQCWLSKSHGEYTDSPTSNNGNAISFLNLDTTDIYLMFSPEISLKNVNAVPSDAYLKLSHYASISRLHSVNDINTGGSIESATTLFTKILGYGTYANTPGTVGNDPELIFNFKDQKYAPNIMTDRSSILYTTITFQDLTYSYNHASHISSNIKHTTGTSVVLRNDRTAADTSNFTAFATSNGIDTTGYGIFNLKRNIVPYGGNTYNARQNSFYSSISDTKNVTQSIDTVYGDTYIGYYDLLYGASVENTVTGNAGMVAYAIPLQSQYNLNYLSSKGVFKGGTAYDFDARVRRWPLLETGNIDGNYYEYNNVYSAGQDVKLYTPKQKNFEVSKNYTTRVRRSGVKINGSETDTWTEFKENDFIEVDSLYGEISTLYNYNNKLLFFQPYGFGVLSINRQQLVNSAESNTAIVLGTGGVLDRFDYLSTKFGTTDSKSIVETSNGFYFYDKNKLKIIQFTGQTSPLSLLAGVSMYIKNTVGDSDCFLFYDPAYEELYFKFSEDSKVLVYSEVAQKFIGFYTYNPTYAINHNNSLYTTDNLSSLYKNTDTENVRWFGGDYQDVIIELMLNPKGTNVVQFNNLHFKTEVVAFDFTSDDYTQVPYKNIVLKTPEDIPDIGINGNYYMNISGSTVTTVYGTDFTDTSIWYDLGSNINHWNKTFDSIHVTNDYQDSNEILLVDTKLQRKFRSWAINIPKNKLLRTIYMTAQDWYDYMTDTYCKVKLKFNGGFNRNIVIHDITTYFTKKDIQ